MYLKRGVVFALLIVILVIIPYKNTSGSMRTYFNSGKYFMEKNSSVLFSLKNSTNKAKRQYEDYVNDVKDLDTKGFTRNIAGKDVFIRYDSYTEMMMVKQKILIPEQLKYAWEMASYNYDIVRNKMISGLRDIYMGLLSTFNSFIIENDKLMHAKSVFEQEKTMFKSGFNSSLHMQKSEYNYLKAQKELDASERNLENMVMRYNSYIGVNVGRKYDEIVYEEEYPPKLLKDMDEYVKKAIENRFEIISIERQLKLLELQLDVLETNRVHEIYTAAKKEYRDVQHDIQSYEIKLQKTCLEIEKEIKNAYKDIIDNVRNVENIEDMIILQKNNYEKMKCRYELGLTSKNMLTQAEITLKQAENSFRIAVYSLNTMIIKLEFASDIGPAYK